MKRKLTILALAVGLIGALLATAGVAVGATSTHSNYDNLGTLDLLLNDTDGDRFVFSPAEGVPDAGPQALGTAGCRVTPTSGDLVELSADANEPGLKDHVLGVRAVQGEGNGTPCARINNGDGQPDAEKLTIAFTGNLANYAADYAEIGLTLKFGATGLVEAFYGTDPNPVWSVEVPCVEANDCGADSGNDRVPVTVDPGGNLLFDRVEISVVSPSDGSVSLISQPGFETFFNLAGDVTAPTIDLVPPATLNFIVGDEFVDPGYTVSDTVDTDPTVEVTSTVPVYEDDEGVTRVASAGQYDITYTVTDSSENTATATREVNVFDGELFCDQETITVGGADTMEGIFKRLDNWDDSLCFLKPYVLEVAPDGSASTILFDPDGGQNAAYSGKVSAPEKSGDNPTGSTLTYDPTGGFDFENMQWCTDDVDPITFDTDGYVLTATLPGTESWCIAAENTVAVGGGDVLTTWTVYGHDDPRMSGA